MLPRLILQDGRDAFTGDALLLGGFIDIMCKRVAGSIQQIKTVLSANPEPAIPVQVKYIDMVVIQAVGILLIMHVALEFLGMWIVTVQAALAGGNP